MKTALADAFEKAGYNAGEARLRSVWADQASRTDLYKAKNNFAGLIVRDRELLDAAVEFIVSRFLSEGHSESFIHQTDADTQNSAGQVIVDTQRCAARAPIPRSEQSNAGARIASTIVSLSVMDTWKLSDGTPIGDVKFGSIPRLKSRFKRDVVLLSLIEQYAVATDPFTSVREAVPIEALQQMIQKSAEHSDANQ